MRYPAALKMPDIIAKMKLQGLHTLSSTPVEFASRITREVRHWAEVIPLIGVQLEMAEDRASGSLGFALGHR
jgi:tripartite-type tricarboxylate transporter receptor subunit TctC